MIPKTVMKILNEKEKRILESCRHGWREFDGIRNLSEELKISKKELNKMVGSLIKMGLLDRIIIDKKIGNLLICDENFFISFEKDELNMGEIKKCLKK